MSIQYQPNYNPHLFASNDKSIGAINGDNFGSNNAIHAGTRGDGVTNFV